MFGEKEVIVKLSEEANVVFEELNKIVGEEKRKGIEGSFHQTLLRSIIRVRDLLKENPFAGDQIKKRQIPDKYIDKYDAENAWRIELANVVSRCLESLNQHRAGAVLLEREGFDDRLLC